MQSARPATIIFDFDGTLYEEPLVYDHFAAELAHFIVADRRSDFLAEWRLAREGRHAARVGLGYDADTDTLFRHARGGAIVSRIDWQGHPLPVDPINVPSPHPPAQDAPPGAPPIETTIVDPDFRSIGDAWGLCDVIALHYGVAAPQRSEAFMATRAFMDGPHFPMRAAPGLAQALHNIRQRRIRLVAMTNSPIETTEAVLRKLDLLSSFDEIITGARKPGGMRVFLAAHPAPDSLLSIGDNYINEIEPALEAGATALYIDRHATNLGSCDARCIHRESISGMVAWLDSL